MIHIIGWSCGLIWAIWLTIRIDRLTQLIKNYRIVLDEVVKTHPELGIRIVN